jgi:hypothetical protein
LPASAVSAAGLAADLEAIDCRLRLRRLDGLEERLGRLAAGWGANREVRRRAEALTGLSYLRDGTLLEPNAIASDRLDVGRKFRSRFLGGRDGAADIPLGRPLFRLTSLSPSPPRDLRASRPKAVTIAGFLRVEDLDPGPDPVWREPVRLFEGDPRVVLALFVFTGDREPPPARPGEEPWESAAVLWIRGTPETLAAAPVRSRYEWLPGPTFFLLEPGGRVRSWRWPHEGWRGFEADVAAALAALPPEAAR